MPIGNYQNTTRLDAKVTPGRVSFLTGTWPKKGPGGPGLPQAPLRSSLLIVALQAEVTIR